MVSYNNQIISVCRMATEKIALHYDGDAEDKLLFLPFLEPKDIVAASVLGQILHLMWDGVGQDLTYARWNLGNRTVDLAPQVLYPGIVPSMKPYYGGGLLLHYINPTSGNHVSRRSTDGGNTWTAETLIDARLLNGPVEHVDVSVSPLTPVTATWDNSKPDA